MQVGVAGRTGCGKSTLMMALYRLVEPSGGRIVIDGIDTAAIGLRDLRSRLALVPQVGVGGWDGVGSVCRWGVRGGGGGAPGAQHCTGPCGLTPMPFGSCWGLWYAPYHLLWCTPYHLGTSAPNSMYSKGSSLGS